MSDQQTTDDVHVCEFFAKLACLLNEYDASIWSDQDGAGYVEVGGVTLWTDALNADKATMIAAGKKWCVPSSFQEDT